MSENQQNDPATPPQPPRRGLGALLQRTTGGSAGAAPDAPAKPVSALLTLPIDQVQANQNQPRKNFDERALRDLEASVREKGVLQPIVVREMRPEERKTDARYQIIAGERRFRACLLADLKEIPVIVKDVQEGGEIMVLSLIENLQRDDLNPIEEAQAYQYLSNFHSMTQEMIAKQVGKGRASVANALRLLELPESVRAAVRSGNLSVGHAKILMGIPDKAIQQKLAAKCQAEDLSVRQLELFAVGDEDSATTGMKSQKAGAGEGRKGSGRSKPAHISDIEEKLSRHFGTKVQVQEGARKGRIVIEFYSVDDFNRITGEMGLTKD